MSSEKMKEKKTDEARRDFLRKSIYAAYATPVITAMLISKANAAASFQAAKDACEANPGNKWLRGNSGGGCCDTNGDGQCG